MWYYAQKIKAQMCYPSHFGMFVYISPLNNWYKLGPDDDDGLINMTTIATHAKANDRFVDVDLNNDVVRTMVVW